MLIASSNGDYTAKRTGFRVQFLYKQQHQCDLEIKTYEQTRIILDGWARLQIPPAQVQHYQALIKGYVGATIDDVTVGKDGEYYINGKSIDAI